MSRQPEKPRPGADQADEAFLSRWSRLKADEGANKPLAAAEREAAPPEGTAEGGAPTEEEIVAGLPDIESLDEVSDFTPFLRDGVPELLKRQALRRLWRVNPVFAEIDGLAEYAEDYTDAASVLTEVKTAYKVGRGYLDQEAEEPATAEAPAETDTGEAPDTAEEAAAEGDGAQQPPCEPQVTEITASPGSGAPSLTEAGVAPDGAQTAEPAAPDREKGRAAARRWGLPEA